MPAGQTEPLSEKAILSGELVLIQHSIISIFDSIYDYLISSPALPSRKGGPISVKLDYMG
jgi:hypothetical protein